MNERKNIVILAGFVLSVSLLAASLTGALTTKYYNHMHFQVLGDICQEIITVSPDAEPAVLAALKEYKRSPSALSEDYLIRQYGYQPTDFMQPAGRYSRLFVLAGFLAGGGLFAVTLWFVRKKEAIRINALTDYLEQVNTGSSGTLLAVGEDDFSKLQDEIYKTVTMLYQTRDTALQAKKNFADNLYNIAHQIKTPLTAMSLTAQLMRNDPSQEHLEQISRQLSRLTRLEESLLLLARIDAGTLPLERKTVDVFTVLMLAADNLQELLGKTDVSVDIPESGALTIDADLEWTMEAVMNLFKNCMEHTPPGGTIHCSYEQNSMHTRIRIWDDGAGFAKEDIGHLFERFYRGQNAGSGGIGIGLALSKAIIESQNGVITAHNLAGGGACFEIRFYSH